MNIREITEENNASRRELGEWVGRLDETSFNVEVMPGWTVSTALCHLAFWDQRALFLLRKWKTGGFEASGLTPLNVDSLNHAATTISRAVPGPAAARLTLASAAAVDSQVEEIGDGLVSQILSAGYERFLRRSLHRREHLQKIEKALAGHSL